LSLNEFKLKNYKNYLKKFTIINIPGFFVLSYLGFKTIVRLKTFILDYWFQSYFNTKEFLIILLLVLISFLIIYLKFYLYKSINKLSLIDSLRLLKKRFYKEYIHFFLLAATLLISGFVFVIILRINPDSAISGIIGSLVSLTIFNAFRTYFSSKA
jgi:ABC-type Fe3+ transport system permease subunit